MDGRTRELIDALGHPGAAIVLELLVRGTLAEKEICQAIDDTSQPTVNRRLNELGRLGLLTRAPGSRQYKDRPWTLADPESTDSLLGAALELSASLADQEGKSRRAAAAALRNARKERRDLGAIPDVANKRNDAR
jgi:DNA-binding HxlR family transcriptional regulator